METCICPVDGCLLVSIALWTYKRTFQSNILCPSSQLYRNCNVFSRPALKTCRSLAMGIPEPPVKWSRSSVKNGTEEGERSPVDVQMLEPEGGLHTAERSAGTGVLSVLNTAPVELCLVWRNRPSLCGNTCLQRKIDLKENIYDYKNVQRQAT